MLPVDFGGEFARLAEVRGRGLPPDQIGIGRVGQAAGDGMPDRMGVALLQPVEALVGPLAGDPRLVALVDVAGDQRRRMGVGARHEDRVDARDIRGEPRRVERADEGGGRQEHLAAEMAALLLRGQLVLEMHRRGARLDHALHQLEGIERSAEAGFRVGDDRREPVDDVGPLEPRDLVGALEGLVDAANQLGNRGRGIERLVGIHLAGIVGVGGDLPAGDVDRLEPGLDLLQRLVAGQRAEGPHERPFGEQPAEPRGAAPGEAVLDPDRAGELVDIGRRIVATNRVVLLCHGMYSFSGKLA